MRNKENITKDKEKTGTKVRILDLNKLRVLVLRKPILKSFLRNIIKMEIIVSKKRNKFLKKKKSILLETQQ